jgi:hypothetical protein
MHIREVGAEDHPRFNKFLIDFPNADVLQAWEWGELKAHGGWVPLRVIGEENGKIIAAATLLKRSLPIPGASILYASRGPVMDTKNATHVREFIEGLKRIARKHGAILLKIDPPIEITDTVSEANLRAVGFTPVAVEGFGGTQPKCVMQLDLTGRTLEEVKAAFHHKWRYNIGLAERKGVTVRLDCGREDIPVFYKLLKETTERDGFIVRPEKYFTDMWDCLNPPGFAKIALTYFEGQPIAGAFCYLFGDRAWYTYGASSNAHRNVMPNHLMQWRLIEWAKENHCRWYDFRGVSPKRGEGDSHLEGLNRFKEGFSPRFVEYIGEYDLPLSPALYWGWNVALPRVRAALKKRQRAESAKTSGGDGA